MRPGESIPGGNRQAEVLFGGVRQADMYPGEARQPDARPGALLDAERRQITVVYIDLAGSSRLAERLDPEDVGALIVAYRRSAAALVDAHGGFVARLFGDGVLAYWGYPRAREDDAHRAVAAGLAIVDGMRALNASLPVPDVLLRVRVGIDTGVVVVGQVAGTTFGGGVDIIGEAPNTAARVQAMAAPDTVCVTDAVRRMVEWRFAFAPHQPAADAIVPPGLVVYRALSEQKGVRSARPTRAERIHGRQVEQDILDRCWRQVCAGECCTVAITGDPGMGKSTLADHLQHAAAAYGGAALRANCFPEGAHSPLFPIRDLLRQTIGIGLMEDADTLRGKIEAAAARHAGDRSYLEYVLPLLDPGVLPAELGTVAATERRRRLYDVILQMLLAHAGDAPLTVIVEDLQWADAATREFLGFAMASTRDARLCLVLTWRADFETAWLGRPDITHIAVMRLRDEAIDAIVADMARQTARDAPRAVALDAEARRTIVQRAEGNPLFAEELVQLASMAPQRGGDMLDLPSSLNASLTARLDGIGEFKRIGQVAAVIGRAFDERVLARVLGRTTGELAAALAGLIAAGLITDQAGGLRTSHAFKHTLLRDAAYNSLLKTRRRELHGETAAVLVADFPQLAVSQPELVAHHLELAGALEPAADWWMRAGDQAGKQSATGDAIRLLERARSLLERLPQADKMQQARLLTLLGGQYVAAHGNASPQVAQCFGEAVTVLETHGGTPEALFAALWGLHTYAMVRAELPRAIAIGARMLQLAQAEDFADGVLQAHRVQGLATLLQGDHAQAGEHYREALRRYDEGRHAAHRFHYGSDPASVVLIQLAWSETICGDFARAEQHALEGIEHAREIAHPHSLVHSLGVDAIRLLTVREHARSDAAAREARALAGRHGFPYWIAWCDVILAATERPDQADRTAVAMAEAIARYQRTGARQMVPYALALQAEAQVACGDVGSAMATLERATALIAETGVRIYEPEVLRVRARAALMDGADDGGALLQEALRVAGAQGAQLFLLRSLLTAAAVEKPPLREQARPQLVDLLLRLRGGSEIEDVRTAQAMLA